MSSCGWAPREARPHSASSGGPAWRSISAIHPCAASTQRVSVPPSSRAAAPTSSSQGGTQGSPLSPLLKALHPLPALWLPGSANARSRKPHLARASAPPRLEPIDGVLADLEAVV